MKKTKDQSNQDANEKTPDQRELNIRGELNERFPEDQLRSSAAMAVPKRSDASLTARGVTSPRSFYLTEAEIAALKKDIYKHKTPSLDVAEVLIALSVSVPTNPMAAAVLHKLRDLNGCDMHLTHIPTPGDDSGLRKLGVHLTSDPNFPSRNLFAG